MAVGGRGLPPMDVHSVPGPVGHCSVGAVMEQVVGVGEKRYRMHLWESERQISVSQDSIPFSRGCEQGCKSIPCLLCTPQPSARGGRARCRVPFSSYNRRVCQKTYLHHPGPGIHSPARQGRCSLHTPCTHPRLRVNRCTNCTRTHAHTLLVVLGRRRGRFWIQLGGAIGPDQDTRQGHRKAAPG